MRFRRGQYLPALRTTLRDTAAAYGYTLTIASCAMLLSTLHGTPREGRLFLFAAGGLSGFATLTALVVGRGAQYWESPEIAFPRVGALNFLAVAAALGAASGVAHAVGSDDLAWFLVPFLATAVYMAIVAGQIIVAGYARSDGDAPVASANKTPAAK